VTAAIIVGLLALAVGIGVGYIVGWWTRDFAGDR